MNALARVKRWFSRRRNAPIFIAAVWDGERLALYANGTLVASQPGIGTITAWVASPSPVAKTAVYGSAKETKAMRAFREHGDDLTMPAAEWLGL